jgi:hypothetical protein
MGTSSREPTSWLWHFKSVQAKWPSEILSFPTWVEELLEFGRNNWAKNVDAGEWIRDGGNYNRGCSVRRLVHDYYKDRASKKAKSSGSRLCRGVDWCQQAKYWESKDKSDISVKTGEEPTNARVQWVFSTTQIKNKSRGFSEEHYGDWRVGNTKRYVFVLESGPNKWERGVEVRERTQLSSEEQFMKSWGGGGMV